MKTLLHFTLIFALFAMSCASETTNNEGTEQDSLQTTETSNTVETAKAETIAVEAKFQMMIANTAGTSYLFKTVEGTELQLFPDQNLTGMEFANGLQPGSTDHAYYDKNFELKYQKRTVQTTGGDMVERLFLSEAKPAEASKTTGITFDELKNIKFAGVEPAWTLEFTDKNIIYNFGYEENPIELVYYGDYDGTNQRLKQISENEVQVRFIHKSALDKGFINVATIKKENCSDGMSDNTYPYSVKLQQETTTLHACGYLKNKTADNDFEIFWKKIQQAVANNDKTAFMALCSPEMKTFFKSQSFEKFIDQRMKQEIAKASVADIQEIDGQKMFEYVISYPADKTTGETYSSTFGFWFKKIDGQWKINAPQMGG